MADSIRALERKLSPAVRKIVALHANGMTMRDAYRKVRPAVSVTSSESCSSRLFKRDLVQSYAKRLQERAEGASVMSAIERREILAKAATGDLVDSESIKRDAKGNVIERTQKTMSKAKAIELDAKLSGDLNEGGGNALILNLGDGASLSAASADVFDGWGASPEPDAIEAETVEVDTQGGDDIASSE